MPTSAPKQQTEETKPKKTTAVKKKAAVKKAPENLILKKSIHINGLVKNADGKEIVVKGGHYPEGTVVTEGMVEAWEAMNKKIGGTTAITKYCY